MPSMTPPPGMNGPAAPQAPTTPGASPAPATPSPEAHQGAQLIIQAVQAVRAIAKAYPAAAPLVQDINNKLREVMAITMQSQNPGEPAAPPNGG